MDLPNFDQTPIIPLRTALKKSNTRQAKISFSFVFPKHLHLAVDVPSKVENTSSDKKKTTFEILEHPYRTSGPSAASFDFLRSLFFDHKPIIPLRTSPKKSKKSSSEKPYFYENRTPLSHLRLWRHDFRIPFRSVSFAKNIDDLIPSLKIDEKPVIPLRTSPKK